MSFIQYITESNPDAAAQLCQNHGMQPQSMDDIAQGLMIIIDDQGDSGLKNVLALHPDKDVIIENFTSGNNYRNASGNCGCGNCKLASMLVKTNQASGGTSTMAPQGFHNQQNNNSNNLLIIGVIALTVIAVIIHKNN